MMNPFTVKALDSIIFQMDMPDDQRFSQFTKMFRPKMAHQIFGCNEIITGYRNLQITLNILPNSFHVRLNLIYDEMLNNSRRGEIADNIGEKFMEWFPHKTDSYEAYEDLKAKEDYTKMFGHNIVSFKDETEKSKFHITVCDRKDLDFLEFHKRFQGLIVFFIDAASIIDVTDRNWYYFYVYKDVKLGDKRVGHFPIGFCTVYNFIASGKVRIAQLFILPNFQMRGLGTRLLGTVYKYFNAVINAQYITVESPCEEFTIMRDKLDLQLILNNSVFNSMNVIVGYSLKMETAAKMICKICPTQIKHLYYILRCFYTKGDPEQYEKFIMYMKKEVHFTYKKKLSRVKTTMNEEEKITRLKRIIVEDCLVSRRIHNDVKKFLKSIKPQLIFLARVLKEK
ncbi:PREDICTED: histone acetyltransferase type B catalytic subunit isoform X2 [Nicrophorus vespilloides]|nr:PREDICTED: histone acetyltransferase type B catalytic subunit isoform X2 [Nicrophorus vespilloides]